MEQVKESANGGSLPDIRSLVLFVTISYGPAWLGLLVVLWKGLAGGAFGAVFQMLLLYGTTLPIVWLAFIGVRRFGLGHAAFWILFLSWQVYGVLLGLAVASAFADGAVSQTLLLEQKMLFALTLLVPLQIFIFPWVFWARRLLRHFLGEVLGAR